ncbi:MAG: hypothetical protein HZB26_13800 [Candidatus Hydrogenedentes bacterium]|nr:hypothetical protein [Candidatus Hydrogenedentota bacterium]
MTASIALAFNKLLIDAEVTSVRELFLDPSILNGKDLAETIALHTQYASDLLHNGREATCPLAPNVRQLLGTLYMDVPKDPWGGQYQFFFPPWPSGGIGNVSGDPFLQYDARDNDRKRKNPVPTKAAVYVVSMGPDGRLDILSHPSDLAEFESDDVTNLDLSDGWRSVDR